MSIKWQRIVEGECEALSEIPEDAFPVEIDGEEVIGFCEKCGMPLTENDDYYMNSDNELICGNCDPSIYDGLDESDELDE